MFELIRRCIDSEGFLLDDWGILKAGKYIALLNPGTLWKKDILGRHWVYGPLGKVQFDITDPAGVIAALLGVQVLLLGSDDAVRAVILKLMNPDSSRTTSFALNCSASYEDVLSGLAKIAESRVCFIGTGGIGSITAMAVCGFGVKSIALVDNDSVERSNLNLQLFYTLDDIDVPKVKAMSHAVSARFPDVTVKTLKSDFLSARHEIESFKPSLIFCTADNPIGINEDVSTFAGKLGCHYLSAGYLFRHAQIKGNIPSSEPQDGTWERSHISIIPSFGPTNVELAGLSSLAIFHTLTGSWVSDSIVTKWDSGAYPRNYQENIYEL